MEKTFVTSFKSLFYIQLHGVFPIKTSFYSQLQGEFLLIVAIFSFVFVIVVMVLMENCSIQLRTSQSISYFFFL